VRFNGSILHGNTNGIKAGTTAGSMTVLVSNSEVDNGVGTGSNVTYACIGDYNQLFATINGSCQ
jgi:hypothetical protein